MTHPVVVVCGLHGGAGTSNLAYNLGVHMVSRGTVLLAETEGSAGDQSALSGIFPLFRLAQLPVEGLGNLRVVSATGDGVIESLNVARHQHDTVIVDSGTTRAPGARELLQVATHVLWVTLARADAARQGRLRLAAIPSLAAKQVLVARAAYPGNGIRKYASELRSLADVCCDRLVLSSDTPEARQSTLTALAAFLG